jgi:hypothetical protein
MTDWGHRLEPAIRQKFVDDTGSTVGFQLSRCSHPEIKWARATPDGIVSSHAICQPPIVRVGSICFRSRTSAIGSAVSGRVRRPHTSNCKRSGRCSLLAMHAPTWQRFIGGNDYRAFTVHRDDRLIADLVTLASDFWRKVEQRIRLKSTTATRARSTSRSDSPMRTPSRWSPTRTSTRCSLAGSRTATCCKELREGNRPYPKRGAQSTRRSTSRSRRLDIGIAKLNKNKELMAPKNWSKETA